jgi:AdoMet-dependent heme synthase
MRGQPPLAPDFDQAPYLVIWETTRACALVCKHCRANAIDLRDPGELDTGTGLRLLEEVAAMGTPIVVLSGGDPLQRADLEVLIRYGGNLGLRMATIPAATERLTSERLRSLKEAGVAQIAFSIDAPSAESHDAFRGVPGSFQRTVAASHEVRRLGVPLQVNTVIGPWNKHQIPAMAELVTRLGVVFWEVFFLVPVGRGASAGSLSAKECEDLFEQLYEIARSAPFVLKVAEAPHYRRHVMLRLMLDEGLDATREASSHLLQRRQGHRRGLGHAPRAVNAGRGFLFVDHRGWISPSGFLPKPAGRYPRDDLAEVYRSSDLFQGLRDPSRLRGRCGRCEFAATCGGSRSRAWALTGDPYAAEPWCNYQPGQLPEAVVRQIAG